jgi:protein gp37
MANSSIEWTEMTWNPTTGCSKISEGCKYCYAEVMTRRLKAMGQAKYVDGFKVRIHYDTLSIPNTWKSPTMVFVNSMSDLFHEEISFEFIEQVFHVMNENPQHVFQILTKRAERLYKLHSRLIWTHNIWMGVTVENESEKYRIDCLRKTSAKVKFLSLEPLLEAMPNLDLKKIDWVIVGGESGQKPRPMSSDWVNDIHEQCLKFNVAFFFKQWGGRNKKAAGRFLNGRTYSEMPKILENSL